MKHMLIDSDVLIGFTRGHLGAATFLKSLDQWRISTVTYIELAQGCRSKIEMERLKQGLERRNTDILMLTPTISKTAIQLIEQYSLSHGLQLADALIAATALEHQMVLLSGNAKHFSAINNLSLQRFNFN